MRRVFVWAHRYVGLIMTIFLVIVGFTGSVLAFNHELDHWLNPELFRVALRDAPMLDPFTLRERAEQLEPHAQVNYLPLRRAPGESFSVTMLQPKIDPSTGESYELTADELFLDPYTGEKLGARMSGEVSLSRANILPFLYRLHTSLAFPKNIATIGGYTLGVVALLWTLDCFIGFYLTLPARRRSAHASATQRSWWRRWAPAWMVKWQRLNFDLHRAGGLWVWPMLFVFAWSSVQFNLNEAYKPVMQFAFEMHDPMDGAAMLDKPLENPRLGWREAYARGRELAVETAARDGFTILEEHSLQLSPMEGAYTFSIRSSRDFTSGATMIAFDADTGALKFVWSPQHLGTGNLISVWLTWLHMALVFGLPMRIFVCAMGMVIVMLSVTGVVIWLRKRRARQFRAGRTFPGAGIKRMEENTLTADQSRYRETHR